MNGLRLIAVAIAAGTWLARKARQQAKEQGVQRAAMNLRKQGVPLELALLILVGKA